MMKSILANVLGMILCLSSTAYANGEGGNVGNGGGVVVCYDAPKEAPNRKIISAQVLDYYETEPLRTVGPASLGGDDFQISEKVQIVLNRIRRLDPFRAEIFQNKYSEMKRSYNVSGTTHLKYISDATTPLKFKEGCELEQGAIQFKNPGSIGFKYVFDEMIWRALKKTPNQLAGLILHEIFYSYDLDQGAKNSDRIREYNALVSSAHFESMTLKEYNEYLVENGFSVFSIRGDEYRSQISEFHKTGEIKTVELSAEARVPLFGRHLVASVGSATLNAQGEVVSCKKCAVLPVGYPYEAYFVEMSFLMPPSDRAIISGTWRWFKTRQGALWINVLREHSAKIELLSTGEIVLHGVSTHDETVFEGYNSMSLKPMWKDATVIVAPNGRIQSVTVQAGRNNPVSIPIPQEGRVRTFKRSQVIEVIYDEAGAATLSILKN